MFLLPKTKGKSNVRQSILDYIKSFISSIEEVHDFKITMKKRSIEIEHEDFIIFFDSQGIFKMGFGTDKENTIETLGSILSEVCRRLNEKDWKEEKEKIELSSYLNYKIEGKYDLLVKLIRNDTLRVLSKTENFLPRRVDVSSDDKEKSLGISITKRKKESIIVTYLLYRYKEAFPLNIAEKVIKDLKEMQDRVFMHLAGEK